MRPAARRPRPEGTDRRGRAPPARPARRLGFGGGRRRVVDRQHGRCCGRLGCGCLRCGCLGCGCLSCSCLGCGGGSGGLFLPGRRPLGLGARLAHRVEKLRLGTDAEQDRVLRRDVLRVPVGALAHRGDRRLGGAEQLADLRVAQLVVVLEQPGDGVGPILPLADRRVAGAPGALGHFRDRGDGLQPERRILLAALQLLAGDLPVRDRIEAADADGDLPVRDALHLERMKAAERRDLIERERGVVDQPYGRGLGHQQFGHLVRSFP